MVPQSACQQKENKVCFIWNCLKEKDDLIESLSESNFLETQVEAIFLKRGAVIVVGGDTEKAQRVGIRIIYVLLDNTFSFNIRPLIKNEQTPSILSERRVLKLKGVLALGFC